MQLDPSAVTRWTSLVVTLRSSFASANQWLSLF